MTVTPSALSSRSTLDGGVTGLLMQAIANLDAWLQTMRQQGGYGGPVVHWWRHSLLYAGPGLDWRYEGILSGYTTLYRKTGQELWRDRVRVAVADLLAGQLPEGGLKASEFEINPGTLGTPHEAAVVLGILNSLDCLESEERSRVLILAKSVLQNLVDKLWDGNVRGFNDRPGIPGRVPNKLATLAEALMQFAGLTGEQQWLTYAHACLEDIVRYQLTTGPYKGAIHQYGPGAGSGDGRLFPYYNARCIPGLLQGAQVFNDVQYAQVAQGIGDFLRTSMEENRWPQVVYTGGGRARTPSWIAGTGDVLRVLGLLGDDLLNHPSLTRLLNAQLPSGGFPTSEGFFIRGHSRWLSGVDWLDALPVSGWNDKVLRLLADLLPADAPVPAPKVQSTKISVRFYGMSAFYEEDEFRVSLRVKGRTIFEWFKSEPWVQTQFRPPAL